MSKQLITREYNGNVFTFREDGYFNMTDAAKKFGKDLSNFMRSPETVEYVEALTQTVKSTDCPIVQAFRGGRTPGTWGHPKLAVFFARWLDVKFAVFCDMVIDDILNKKAELTITQPAESMAMKVPQSFPEALRLAAELAEKNERLALENKEMAPKAVVFDNCMALRQESLATFVRTLEGVNTMAIKGDLADLGYLYRTVGAGKYRVYAKYRDVLFTEKLIAHPTRPVYEILPTPEGKKLIAQLYRDGKLTMKKAYAAA
ncbi:KilA-N domain-containing protein [Metapseudomonas otitidis]|uniref:KilA-N domain-containing protein n=1 Tax=Metapseudomonas otitidis TaxID=319939 RepID=UPI002449F52F|nr:KilA-N domain-containing protein [Pseudomonas otitidis]MDG9783946.1 KilA-N domain-containing protein [Pseudomonas otitidis]